MLKFGSCLAVLWLGASASAGGLVIAGGALDAAAPAVHRAFIDAALPQGDFVIVPSASSTPATSARAMAGALARLGVAPARIVVAHVALLDDPATADVDERRWADGARDPAEIAKVAGAAAIWFTGGDQVRSQALLLAGGRDTPMLVAMRARLAAGAVVGGSSAGAAIMSVRMILRGDSMGALTRPLATAAPADDSVEGEQLAIGAGFGFFDRGLVDQHFDRQARLGRLTRAIATLPARGRIGWGIDEDTALAIDLDRRAARVIGRGNVTLLDARAATFGPPGRFTAAGVRLTMLSAGDRVALDTLELTQAGGRAPLPIRRGFNPIDSGGVAVPSIRLATLLAGDLVGNPGATSIGRFSFLGDRGVRYTFAKTAATRGWRDGDGVTMTGIDLTIAPAPVVNPAPGIAPGRRAAPRRSRPARAATVARPPARGAGD